MTQQGNKEKLKALAPVEAVQAWLDGAFGIGDETGVGAGYV